MKNQKGITLVALIITIIVMLILVSVSIAVVINSDLIGTANSAKTQTEGHYTSEGTMNDTVNINNQMVNISTTYGN